MDDKSRDYASVKAEIDQLVSKTMEDVKKLQGDIKKMDARGLLQFNFNPPGMSDDKVQLAKDKAKLEGNVSLLKEHTLEKVELLSDKLPPAERNKIIAEAQEKLYPDTKAKEHLSKSHDNVNDKRLGLSFNTDARLNASLENHNKNVVASRFLSDKTPEQTGEKKESVNERKMGRSKFADLLRFNSDRQIGKNISDDKSKGADKEER